MNVGWTLRPGALLNIQTVGIKLYTAGLWQELVEDSEIKFLHLEARQLHEIWWNWAVDKVCYAVLVKRISAPQLDHTEEGKTFRLDSCTESLNVCSAVARLCQNEKGWKVPRVEIWWLLTSSNTSTYVHMSLSQTAAHFANCVFKCTLYAVVAPLNVASPSVWTQSSCDIDFLYYLCYVSTCVLIGWFISRISPKPPTGLQPRVDLMILMILMIFWIRTNGRNIVWWIVEYLFRLLPCVRLWQGNLCYSHHPFVPEERIVRPTICRISED